MIMTREELNQDKQQEIFDEQKHEKRKKITIFVFKIVFFVIIGVLIFYLYTTFVSSKVLSVKEYRVVNNRVPNNFNGLKIVHFSDLHYGTTVFIDDLKHIVDEMNKRNPDLVLFTGDLIDKNYDLSIDEQEEIIKQLKRIKAALGKYAIPGEEDKDEFITLMNQGEFDVLANSYDLIYKDDDTPILLIGLDSLLADKSDVKSGFSYFNEATHNSNIFSITLAHEPDVVDEILNSYSTDLFLAGHSHNGNIRIPFVGGIYKVDGAKNYHQEFYSLDKTNVYISSGIGTNGPGFRLFCRPSINFFRISNT